MISWCKIYPSNLIPFRFYRKTAVKDSISSSRARARCLLHENTTSSTVSPEALEKRTDSPRVLQFNSPITNTAIWRTILIAHLGASRRQRRQLTLLQRLLRWEQMHRCSRKSIKWRETCATLSRANRSVAHFLSSGDSISR